MKFGIDKYAVLELERGRLVRSEGIELLDGEMMKEVDQEGYKYLGVLQLDKTMNKEMQENIGNEQRPNDSTVRNSRNITQGDESLSYKS